MALAIHAFVYGDRTCPYTTRCCAKTIIDLAVAIVIKTVAYFGTCLLILIAYGGTSGASGCTGCTNS